MTVQYPLISVVIPNYNKERFLPECLNSVLGQDYPNLEIIVVDDCSTDGSHEILRSYIANDDRLKVLFKDINEGVVKAREDGITYSLGVYISSLDSDDIYLNENKLSSEYQVMKGKEEKTNRETVVYSRIELITDNGESIGTPNINIVEGDILLGLLSRNIMIPRDFLFRKKYYYESGGFDSKVPIYEDWDLKLRMAENADFYYSGVKGIGYRQHTNGLSRTNYRRHVYWLLYVYGKNFSIHKFLPYCLSFIYFARVCIKLLAKGWVKALSKA